MFAGNFAPAGWMFCEGQLLPISENETLFQLIGTTYGGDGQSTFALPDLRGRLPIHQGNGFILAETGGAEEITLTANQIPDSRRHGTSRVRGRHNRAAGPMKTANQSIPIDAPPNAFHRRMSGLQLECIRQTRNTRTAEVVVTRRCRPSTAVGVRTPSSNGCGRSARRSSWP